VRWDLVRSWILGSDGLPVLARDVAPYLAERDALDAREALRLAEQGGDSPAELARARARIEEADAALSRHGLVLES
jgi:hypothetical protein